MDTKSCLIQHHDEHSHRSAAAPTLDNPDDYETIFVHGGGLGSFSALAYSFVGTWAMRKHRALGNSVPELKSAVENLKLDYIITGSWSGSS